MDSASHLEEAKGPTHFMLTNRKELSSCILLSGTLSFLAGLLQQGPQKSLALAEARETHCSQCQISLP